MRRDAVEHAATRPLRSALFQSGLRTWLRMMSSAVSLSCPSLYSLKGGMMTPSSKMVCASVGIDDGVLPPTSDMWPNIDDHPTTRPLWKIGSTMSQSLAWLMAAPHAYGSEVRRMSPSPTVPLKLSRKSGTDRPNCPTTIFPLGSAMSGNSSCCSRIPGESAVRKSTSSISYRALRSAFSMMSSVIGSTGTVVKGVVEVSMIVAIRSPEMSSGREGISGER